MKAGQGFELACLESREVTGQSGNGGSFRWGEMSGPGTGPFRSSSYYTAEPRPGTSTGLSFRGDPGLRGVAAGGLQQGDQTPENPGVVTAAGVVQIVKEKPFLPVREADKDKTGPAGNGGLPGLNDPARAPLGVVAMAHPFFPPEIEPVSPLPDHGWFARGLKVSARRR